MKAKFDKIVIPISDVLVEESSRKDVKFNAFFANVMFHEVAHGLGIKNTLDGSGTVRHALKEQYSALEEAKADILGLFLVTKLHEMGEYNNTTLEENYTTFMAGIFRSVRFGAASAHGKANMLEFNYSIYGTIHFKSSTISKISCTYHYKKTPLLLSTLVLLGYFTIKLCIFQPFFEN